MRLYSMFCASLDKRGRWGKNEYMYMCVVIAIHLETTTTLLNGCTPRQNKKFEVYFKRKPNTVSSSEKASPSGLGYDSALIFTISN